MDYEGATYSGEHEAIISDDIWRKVQRVLLQNRAHNSRTGGKEIRNRYGALLRGLLYCIPCNAAMSHTISSKNNKHYRYYVCQGAQQKGWKSCPSKSLNAHDIEQAVVEHIRGISSNSTIIQKTFATCQEKVILQLRMLQDEQQMLQKRIQKAQGLLCDANVIRNPERIVGVHEQLQQAEQRLSSIIQEKVALEQSMFTESEIISALTSFSPVWDSLTPHEQSKLINLLIERVGFDGKDGSVSVQFRSPQLQQLCTGGLNA